MAAASASDVSCNSIDNFAFDSVKVFEPLESVTRPRMMSFCWVLRFDAASEEEELKEELNIYICIPTDWRQNVNYIND
jgi:hypothetical protein